MKCVDRSGNRIKENELQNKILKVLYKNVLGRILIKPLVKPGISYMMGKILSSSYSRCLISPFIKRNKINMEEYEEASFFSYNDFFTRRIKVGQRTIDYQPDHLIAPCDSRLSIYPITKDSHFEIKNTQYTLHSLLRSKKLANFYENGLLLLFRLTVDDYHRYCYIDNGKKSKNYRIEGVFHTVNPMANEVLPVYKENTREYTVIDTENFGRVVVMEVGALLVGKIVNYHEKALVQRGEEKGRFEFGGSSIIILLEKDRVVIDEDIRSNSAKGIETRVKLGEKIGKLMKSSQSD